uniref:ribonuclease H n=1 Tax=viral metagenome TaxID=1070528 RepID=A0A6C0E1C4_9ZZZZ
MIKIYTDGSCLKNPGPGGWGVIMIDADGYEWHLSEGEGNTTNNRMELKAVIEGLKLINDKEECTVYSDSKLTINCAEGKWNRKANLDLWKEYDIVSKRKKINYQWVKAHNGDYYNETVDKMAFNEAKKYDL